MIGMKMKTDAIREHREWVEAYLEQSRVASSGYPAPLTKEQIDAYRTLPDLIDQCRETFKLIPVAVRPVHYLCV
jgi:hypothetical protein